MKYQAKLETGSDSNIIITEDDNYVAEHATYTGELGAKCKEMIRRANAYNRLYGFLEEVISGLGQEHSLVAEATEIMDELSQ